MPTIAAGMLLAERYAQLKQAQSSAFAELIDRPVTVYAPKPIASLIIKPGAKTWPDLQHVLVQVVNLPGLMTTVRELYDQGYGAELETAAEIALATAKKSPFHLFAAMVSKKSGNWATKTLKIVHEAWEVRRNAATVLERLKLPITSTKAILALAWRLRGSILRYLGIATEQGTGIKNPAGVFFALTKKQPMTA